MAHEASSWTPHEDEDAAPSADQTRNARNRLTEQRLEEWLHRRQQMRREALEQRLSTVDAIADATR